MYGWKATLTDGRALKEGRDGCWPDLSEPIKSLEVARRVIDGADRYWFVRRGAAALGGPGRVLFTEFGGVFAGNRLLGFRVHQDGLVVGVDYQTIADLSREHFSGVSEDRIPFKSGTQG